MRWLSLSTCRRHALFVDNMMLKMPATLIVLVPRHGHYMSWNFYILKHQSTESDRWMLIFADTCTLELQMDTDICWHLYTRVLDGWQHVIFLELDIYICTTKALYIYNTHTNKLQLFSEANLQRTLRLSVLGLEQFGDGWPTEKFFPGAHEWGQSMQKRHVLVYEDSLCPS